MVDNNKMEQHTTYILGFVNSVKLVSSPDSPKQHVHEPTLLIYGKQTNRVASEFLDLKPILPLSVRRVFTVPVHALETPLHCIYWITEKFQSSMLLKLVVSEIEDPLVLLKDLLWKMKENWEATGEICLGLVHMDTVQVVERYAEYCQRTMDAWLNIVGGKFKGSPDDDCPICFEVFDESSSVCELECRHVFHCRCMGEWLKIKGSCPCCRSEVDGGFKFWMHKEKSSTLSDPLASLSFPMPELEIFSTGVNVNIS